MEKIPILGKTEGKRSRGRRGLRWLDSLTDSVGMNLSKLHEIVKDRGAWGSAVHGVSESQTRLSDWMTTTTTQVPSAHLAVLTLAA